MRDSRRAVAWGATPLFGLIAAALAGGPHPSLALALAVPVAMLAIAVVWFPVRATRLLVRLGLADAHLGASLLHASPLTWWRHAVAWVLVITPFCIAAAHRLAFGVPPAASTALLLTVDTFARSRIFLDVVELYDLGGEPAPPAVASALLPVTFTARVVLNLVLTRVLLSWIQRAARRLRREDLGRSVLDQVERAIHSDDVATARPLLVAMRAHVDDALARLAHWSPPGTLPEEVRLAATARRAAPGAVPRPPAATGRGLEIAGASLAAALAAVAWSHVEPRAWVCGGGVVAAVVMVVWSRDVVSLLLAGRIRRIESIRGLIVAQGAVSVVALACVIELTANWVAAPLAAARAVDAAGLPSSAHVLAALNVLRAEVFFDAFEVRAEGFGVARLGPELATRLLVTRSAVDLVVLASISRVSWRLTLSYVANPHLAAACPVQRLATEAARCDAASGVHAEDALRALRLRMRALVRHRRPSPQVAALLFEHGFATAEHLLAELRGSAPLARARFAIGFGDALAVARGAPAADAALTALRGELTVPGSGTAERAARRAVAAWRRGLRAIANDARAAAVAKLRGAAAELGGLDGGGDAAATAALWEAHCLLQTDGPAAAAPAFGRAHAFASGASEPLLAALARIGAGRCAALRDDPHAAAVLDDASTHLERRARGSALGAPVEFTWLTVHRARAALSDRPEALPRAVGDLARTLADLRAAGLDPDGRISARAVALRCRAATEPWLVGAPPDREACRRAWRGLDREPNEQPGCVDRFATLEARVDLCASARPWRDAAERDAALRSLLPACRDAGRHGAIAPALAALRTAVVRIGELAAAGDATAARRGALTALRLASALHRAGLTRIAADRDRLRSVVRALGPSRVVLRPLPSPLARRVQVPPATAAAPAADASSATTAGSPTTARSDIDDSDTRGA